MLWRLGQIVTTFRSPFFVFSKRNGSAHCSPLSALWSAASVSAHLIGLDTHCLRLNPQLKERRNLFVYNAPDAQFCFFFEMS